MNPAAADPHPAGRCFGFEKNRKSKLRVRCFHPKFRASGHGRGERGCAAPRAGQREMCKIPAVFPRGSWLRMDPWLRGSARASGRALPELSPGYRGKRGALGFSGGKGDRFPFSRSETSISRFNADGESRNTVWGKERERVSFSVFEKNQNKSTQRLQKTFRGLPDQNSSRTKKPCRF